MGEGERVGHAACVASLEGPEAPRWQAGGGRGACVRASATRASSWQRRKMTGREAVVGWAGQLQCWAGWWATQVRPRKFSLSLVSVFLFCFSVLV